MKEPSKERGCIDKMRIGKRENVIELTTALSIKNGKRYGVYSCSHCDGFHLTTKLEGMAGEYAPLVYVTP